MTMTMNRRSALQGTVAVGALALPAGTAAAQNATALVDVDHSLLSAWRELLATTASYNTGDEDRPDREALWARITELQAEIEQARPDDLAGLAVQAAYLENWCDGSIPGEEHVDMLGAMTAKLAALASVTVERHRDDWASS